MHLSLLLQIKNPTLGAVLIALPELGLGLVLSPGVNRLGQHS